MLAPLAMLLALGAVPANQGMEGVQLALPPGFERLDPAVFEGTAALVPVVGEEGRRGTLVAAFAEARPEGAASMWLGRVEKPLDFGPELRERVAAAVAGHFRQELDLEVSVDRPTVVNGARSPRVEAIAHPRLSHSRIVRFAFYPAGAQYLVFAAAYPESREQELSAAITAAFDAFEADVPVKAPDQSSGLVVRAAAFGLVGLLVVLVLGLRRRTSVDG